MNDDTREFLEKDGGSAFLPSMPIAGGGTLDMTGLTVRDYFAGQYLAGNCWLQGTAEEHAKDAYAVADAMLAERAKP